ncbi:MAG: hypothetical protein AAGG38_13255 [Planctomycetota bacterium]
MAGQRGAAVVGAGLLAACVWVVHQGGFLPAVQGREGAAGSMGSLAGLVLILWESLPLLGAWWLGAAGYGYALRQRGVMQIGVGMAALLVAT